MLYTCVIIINQHGREARALKDHESLGGGRTWSAPRLTWETTENTSNDNGASRHEYGDGNPWMDR